MIFSLSRFRDDMIPVRSQFRQDHLDKRRNNGIMKRLSRRVWQNGCSQMRICPPEGSDCFRPAEGAIFCAANAAGRKTDNL